MLIRNASSDELWKFLVERWDSISRQLVTKLEQLKVIADFQLWKEFSYKFGITNEVISTEPSETIISFTFIASKAQIFSREQMKKFLGVLLELVSAFNALLARFLF